MIIIVVVGAIGYGGYWLYKKYRSGRASTTENVINSDIESADMDIINMPIDENIGGNEGGNTTRNEINKMNGYQNEDLIQNYGNENQRNYGNEFGNYGSEYGNEEYYYENAGGLGDGEEIMTDLPETMSLQKAKA